MTMRAALFHGPHKPLTIEEVPRPSPGWGEILVKVAACGVCHSDLHYLEGLPTFKQPPLILGHEAAGIVEGVGEGVTTFREGDRVLLSPVTSCGRCPLCRRGRENICADQRMLGNNVDGAFAEFVVASARDAFPLPEGIPLEEGCIISDAISTPYHAVKNRAAVRPGDVVVIFGCGGVGINAVQIAAASGARVIAVDLVEQKLAWAKQFGAAAVFNPTGREAVKELRRLTDGGPDIVIEAIGNPTTIQQGYELVRSGGRLCVIGYTNQSFPFTAAKLMYREVEIVGSLGCRPVDFPPLIEMVRRGTVLVKEVVTHRLPLAEVNEAFDLMKKGEALRVIVLP